MLKLHIDGTAVTAVVTSVALAILGIVLGAAIACTPAQQAHTKTALEVNRCVTDVTLRHIDEDMKDPVVLATLASEITLECSPILEAKAEPAPAP